MGTAGTALLGAQLQFSAMFVHVTKLLLASTAAGGGGLLAGALLTEVYEHHEEREREEGFEEGQPNLAVLTFPYVMIVQAIWMLKFKITSSAAGKCID